MRWIRLLSTLMRASFKPKLKGTETVTKAFRVWITDIDVKVMNHAAIMTIFENGRLDFMVRSNFFKVATKNNCFSLLKQLAHNFTALLKCFKRLSCIQAFPIWMTNGFM